MNFEDIHIGDEVKLNPDNNFLDLKSRDYAFRLNRIGEVMSKGLDSNGIYVRWSGCTGKDRVSCMFLVPGTRDAFFSKSPEPIELTEDHFEKLQNYKSSLVGLLVKSKGRDFERFSKEINKVARFLYSWNYV